MSTEIYTRNNYYITYYTLFQDYVKQLFLLFLINLGLFYK